MGFAEAFIAKATLPNGGQYIPRRNAYSRFPEFHFSSEDVRKWLKDLAPDKAAEPNATSPRVYKKLSTVLYIPLYTIHQRMFQLWPSSWKHSAVCPIFKKKDPAEYTNYRAISCPCHVSHPRCWTHERANKPSSDCMHDGAIKRDNDNVFPPRHPRTTEQPTTLLIGAQKNKKINMEDHITHVIKKARIAKRQLMRMRPYCTPQQLPSLYKTMVWSALEQGSVCYAHASEPLLRKLQAFQQSTIRMLRIENNNISSMETRRKTAHAAMIHKQTILHRGLNTIQELFPAAPPDPRSHLLRASTSLHPHQLQIPRSSRDLKIYDQFITPFRTFNSLPASVFPTNECLRLPIDSSSTCSCSSPQATVPASNDLRPFAPRVCTFLSARRGSLHMAQFIVLCNHMPKI
ncbi:hypothetical protein CAPTEDRAFT_201282 [Capitella teleta]|uniref:Uncharacterized protein n=1 Tax=Capitella teleta TaxID=283909 RepID=R7UKZ6_CAPTE|nr:hypothetical protein CAPTEDRAFT_201282 [Capitella teleta]|eukprot:ELU06783.1 hypothetical protein CAPTEDRAFT_201282 [Capitella teleta]